MTVKRITGAAAAATMVLSLGAAIAAPTAAMAAPAPCGTATQVRETLPNGTVWDMCWRMQTGAGLILEKVTTATKRNPTPVQILDNIRLAQLNVPYDHGGVEYNDVTEYGLGGSFAQTIAGDDCKGGSAREGSDGENPLKKRKLLCVSAEPSGLAYRASGEDKVYSKLGHDLVLRSIAQIGWYEYVTEYRFHDDGTVSARLGATGDLANDFSKPDTGWPIGKGAKDYETNHFHTAFWRVDFNIDGKGGEKVEQYDTKTDGKDGETGQAILKTSKTDIAKEGSFTKTNQRWWRVASPTKNTDGHLRSYELVTGPSDVYEAHPEMKPDVTFTQNQTCEKYATDNTDPQCANRTTVLDYAKDKQDLKDPIMWVRVGFHHVPRDEDQSPMPLHWQGFDLSPRDFTAVNPLVPDGRTNVNGSGN
ncbi:copper amine oxidase [Jidongwangia harbinensis]|uniref:copper amine oxidase n=1 Tax=Jidongwangia harbinensis TaxID=2878561 RepID=UPI001CD9BB57|nr:primary-amine oxidase [Jidongwangia harbinensis]MCA2214865.1 primary-amine oxidase [Jidongwangia harbinensis]